MHRITGWIFTSGLIVLLAGTAMAQETPQPGRLIARTQWVRLEIVAGRIRTVSPRLGQKATLRADLPEAGIRESLTFAAEGPASGSLRYEFSDARQLVLLEVHHAEDVSLTRAPQNESGVALVRLEQQPSRGIRLHVDVGGNIQDRTAASLWHLVLADPDTCRQHLLPLLDGLRPGWRLEDKCREVEESLLAVARTAGKPDPQRLAELIAQLNAADFRTRQAADRELRERGPATLPYLESWDDRPLSAEQRTRLERIRQTLNGAGPDTPPRVAMRLAGDPAVWLALLDRNDAQKRTIASQRLSLLAGRPIDFDALADESQRRKQRDRLEAELGLSQPSMSNRGGPTRLR